MKLEINQQEPVQSWTVLEQHALLNGLLDTVNDAVTVVDKDGIVLYWNHQAEIMYGISRVTIVGKRIAEFFQRESIMLFQVMESGTPIRQLYHEPRPGVHVMINTSPIFDAKGQLLGAIAIESNMTSYVKLSAEMYRKSDAEKFVSVVAPFKPEQLHRARLVVERKRPLLLTGEVGSGRRSCAEWIYDQLELEGLFVTMSCANIPEGMLEAELFGYQGESDSERPGKLDQAENGILFLKDVDQLPLPVQEKLHDMLTSGSYSRMKGSAQLTCRCRIIATYTGAAQREEDAELPVTWLSALYYTFVQHHVPAVRERVEELPQLCNLYIAEAADKYGFPQPVLQHDAMAQVAAYDWPNNLPQLRSAMEHAALAAHDAGASAISAKELPDYARLTTLAELTEDELPLSAHSEEMERSRIGDALKRAQGNKARAARMLGISRGALYYKLRQYELE
ncbi:sigma-54-dependent Fis family transcriptional regulator [Paenibacillus assamensis]|uniref:sigma-54-dependent Fis family transcriptional regulator n=1 Tax=Paenibacillus assamensis TaxID=311244 RepID=UPI00041EE920|nr:sigma-54-dependent Fis family transcriptional regulator [Paenibacillus assamensis]